MNMDRKEEERLEGGRGIRMKNGGGCLVTPFLDVDTMCLNGVKTLDLMANCIIEVT